MVPCMATNLPNPDRSETQRIAKSLFNKKSVFTFFPPLLRFTSAGLLQTLYSHFLSPPMVAILRGRFRMVTMIGVVCVM